MAGVSDNENKETIKEWIDALNPLNVLDIGAGSGTYAKLAKSGEQQWTALEVFAPYVKMFDLNSLYGHIYIGDARYTDYSVLPSRLLLSPRQSAGLQGGWGYSLIIAADMLEHMPKDDAKLLIERLRKHCRHLLLCFPVEHQEQHAGDEGNDFETHIDHWTYDEMDMYLNHVIGVPVEKQLVGDVLAYFLVKGEL